MTQKVRIELRLILPDIPDERDACVARLESRLGRVRGLSRGHVVSTGREPAYLCLHYDPDVLSLAEVERIARAAGAEDYDAVGDLEWISPVGRGIRFPSGIRLLGATRDLIEWGVRKRVTSNPQITTRSAVDVAGLRLDAAGRVVGLNLEDRSGPEKTAATLDAELVVDAGGRGSRTPQWLEAHNYPRPRETIVNGFLGYASRLVRPPSNWNADWKTFHIQCAPPARRRGGVIATVEGGNWIVTLAGGLLVQDRPSRLRDPAATGSQSSRVTCFRFRRAYCVVMWTRSKH